MNERLKYFDVLRGLAIIGVVAIHSTGIGYTFSDKSFYFNFTVIWRQMINFSVPLFLSISGFFLANKVVNTKIEYFNFLKKQIPRVFIPYFLWSILYLAIAFIRGATLKHLIYMLLTFQSSGPFYFVILIIEYYILLPLLQKFASIKGLIFSGLISSFFCLVIFYFRYFTNIQLPIFIYASAPSWLIFYVLGIYIRKNGIIIERNKIIIFSMCSLGLSLLETYALYYKFGSIGDSVTAVKISSFIYSIFIILFAFKNVNTSYKSNRVLVFIGEISFGIFLSHMFFMSCVNFLINRLFPVINNYALLKQFILIIIVFACCLTFALIVRKFDKQKAMKYLGQ